MDIEIHEAQNTLNNLSMNRTTQSHMIIIKSRRKRSLKTGRKREVTYNKREHTPKTIDVFLNKVSGHEKTGWCIYSIERRKTINQEFTTNKAVLQQWNRYKDILKKKKGIKGYYISPALQKILKGVFKGNKKMLIDIIKIQKGNLKLLVMISI